MRILFLAPQPFFQERGTPIAVRMAVETLASIGKLDIDLLTYHQGDPVDIPGVRVIRMWVPRILARIWLKDIPPGPSFKKLVADFFFSLTYFWVMFRRRNEFVLAHAVEEAGFLAWIGRTLFRIPYVYDMDSQLALQLSEAWRWCRPLKLLLEAIERKVIRKATSVIAVCEALADYARNAGARSVHVITDVSLLPDAELDPKSREKLRAEFGVSSDEQLILYVGNLEQYQGIGLLLDAFKLLAASNTTVRLAIVGGNQLQISNFQQQVINAGLGARAIFVGPRPLSMLPELLAASDVLVSPRLTGNNTPMKIYSYLHAGKPLVATRLATHTQVLTNEVSILCEPTPVHFASGMDKVLSGGGFAGGIAERAYRLAEKHYTRATFRRKLITAYQIIFENLERSPKRITVPPVKADAERDSLQAGKVASRSAP